MLGNDFTDKKERKDRLVDGMRMYVIRLYFVLIFLSVLHLSIILNSFASNILGIRYKTKLSLGRGKNRKSVS